MPNRSFLIAWPLFLLISPVLGQPPMPTETPLVRVADLSIGESQTVELCDGSQAQVKLLELREERDPIREAVRRADVRLEVNSQEVTLTSANYHRPVTIAGVQIDCPITKGYQQNSNRQVWGLEKDVRVRLWPAGSPLMPPGTFVYPVKQRWFASGTQMANEPVFVDGGERPDSKQIYYHWGLDIGGSEALVEVVAATDGLVVSSGTTVLPGYEETPVRPRYDVIYLLDSRGWYYRYSHLHTIDEAVRPGQMVKMGQQLGLLGKEGGSGGWSHLHFDITSRQPSGEWGIQEGYALLWEAYQRQYRPKLIAVARPHHFVQVGQKALLDATRSWTADGQPRFEWQFMDGAKSEGPQIERAYDRAGVYSEILKLTDSQGNVDYDFAVVHVLDPSRPKEVPPSIHANYYPTFDIQPSNPVTFKVRTFRTTEGEETWDFGDGSPTLTVRSDGNAVQHAKDGYAVTQHRYQRPGHYLVRIERTNGRGERATAHLDVRVGEGE
jgi:murein DD-endopeptidase MepM/ murein hydrolase activator NlpD